MTFVDDARYGRVRREGVRVLIGPRIRSLREERGITLTAFAASVGVSTGMISQVERGVTDPSLDTLRRIAQALEVPIFSLFRTEEPQQPVRVVRRDARMFVRSPHGEITYSRVSAGNGQLEVLEGLLEPGGSSSADPWAHPSEETAVVLDGALVLQVAEDEFALAEGDSCSFDSRLPHRYRNPGRSPCRFLISITPPSY